jgi:hypothetical protein
MATITLTRAVLAKTESGNEPMVINYPEAASQTFVKGEFVYLASGYVTECGDNPTTILGMAMDDAHNDSSAGTHKVGVAVFSDNTILEMNKVNASGTAQATAYSDIGAVFGIYRDTTNNIVNAVASPAYPRLICIGLSGSDQVGDTGGRLLLRVIGTYRQLASTSGG